MERRERKVKGQKRKGIETKRKETERKKEKGREGKEGRYGIGLYHTSGLIADAGLP